MPWNKPRDVPSLKKNTREICHFLYGTGGNLVA